MAIFTCATLLAAVDATAQRRATNEELAALPRWCHATRGFSELPGPGNSFKDYMARYGPGWSHVHHYCWALTSIMRYDRFGNSRQAKAGYAMSALGDIRYVLNRVEPDFVLWADIVNKKTRLLIRERELDQAMASAREMLAAYPERADSYGLMAEVLFEVGRRGDARKILEEGETKVKDPERLEKIRSVMKL